MTVKLLIRKVNLNKANQHKYITIPKDEDIQAGDYVVVRKRKSLKGAEFRYRLRTYEKMKERELPKIN